MNNNNLYLKKFANTERAQRIAKHFYDKDKKEFLERAHRVVDREDSTWNTWNTSWDKLWKGDFSVRNLLHLPVGWGRGAVLSLQKLNPRHLRDVYRLGQLRDAHPEFANLAISRNWRNRNKSPEEIQKDMKNGFGDSLTHGGRIDTGILSNMWGAVSPAIDTIATVSIAGALGKWGLRKAGGKLLSGFSKAKPMLKVPPQSAFKALPGPVLETPKQPGFVKRLARNPWTWYMGAGLGIPMYSTSRAPMDEDLEYYYSQTYNPEY